MLDGILGGIGNMGGGGAVNSNGGVDGSGGGFLPLLGGILKGDQDGNGMVDEAAGVAAGAAVTYFSGGTLAFLAPFAGDFVNGLVDSFLD
jgi:hypothetical protein